MKKIHLIFFQQASYEADQLSKHNKQVFKNSNQTNISASKNFQRVIG